MLCLLRDRACTPDVALHNSSAKPSSGKEKPYRQAGAGKLSFDAVLAFVISQKTLVVPYIGEVHDLEVLHVCDKHG